MKRKMFLSCCLLAIALVTLGANDSCKAPMDATGEYTGTWKGLGEDDPECPLSMTLTQDVNAEPPENLAVEGTVYVDYSCIDFPDWFPTPETAEIMVAGLMDPNTGKIALGSGGCGPGACAILALDGQGESEESGGEYSTPYMTSYSGTWTYLLGIAFFEAMGAQGTFQVTREE